MSNTMPLYLDYNATTPVDPRVLEVMIDIYKNHYGNASSRTHQFGMEAKKLVNQARQSIAKILDIEPTEVIFTSGATESDNLAILGLAKWGKENGKMHIISTPIEHKAVLEPLHYLASQGFEIDLVPVGSSGRVDADEVTGRIRADTLLVSVMHVNNETGIIQPVDKIGAALAGTDIFFHIDAAQSFGKLVEELRNIKYDLLSVSGHKIYGPQGIGALITRRNKYHKPPLEPLMRGGGQEGGMRPGTLPVALIAGLGKAAEIAGNEYRDRDAHNRKIRQAILDKLQKVEHVFIGDQNHVISHTISVAFPGRDSEALMLQLKDKIAISNGSACTSHSYEPSHVLSAMGMDRDLIESTVRISWGVSIIPDSFAKFDFIIS
jgi:cysteine desulfurase